MEDILNLNRNIDGEFVFFEKTEREFCVSEEMLLSMFPSLKTPETLDVDVLKGSGTELWKNAWDWIKEEGKLILT